MNNYIILDGYKYATRAKNWGEVSYKPATVRYLLSGEIDVTYAESTPHTWVGEIIAPVTARDVDWGTIETLKTTLAKRSAVDFTDHYGYACTVHMIGEQRGISLSQKWDDQSNQFFMPVELVEVTT